MIVHNNVLEPWKVTLVDTGLNTMTGGRIKRVREYLDGDTFMLTYGDGVADIDLKELLDYHRSHGKMATITAAQPGGRFGILEPLRILRKRKKRTGAGSTPDLWFWNRRSWILLRVTILCLKRNHWWRQPEEEN